MVMSDSSGNSNDVIKTKDENFTKITVNVVSNWGRKKPPISDKAPTLINIERDDEKPRKLLSFNNYITQEDKIQSVNDEKIPDKIEGTYKHDFNILDVHNTIVKKFQHEKEHKIKKLEIDLKAEEKKINGRQNMVERKNSLKVINEIKKNIEDIISEKSFREYLQKIQPLLEGYNLLGTMSNVISFAKKRLEEEISEDQSPEPHEDQNKRHQLILDFIEIARRYIQIDLIREIKEGNNCPVCGTKLDDTMSNMDDDGISICPDCGVERISVVRTKFYQDNARTNNSGNNYEDRANFKKVLMRYQGKQPDKPPLELYERLGEYFTDSETPKIDILGDNIRKFLSPDEIRNLELNSEGEKIGTSRSLMYKALKDTGNSDYYDHINIILNEMWGWALPDVSHLEDKIMEDYDTSQRIYEVIPKDRKSSLNSQFRLFKHLRRLGYPCKSKDFRIPTTHDILEFHNSTWAKMCEILNWENL